MINVFIPHRWDYDDYDIIGTLLDRTKYNVRNYSVPSSSPLDTIDRRFNVDPQIQRKIKYASVVVCSNRPANGAGMASEEIRYAISIGKPIVAVHITDNTSSYISSLGIPIIPCRKDSLETWIVHNVGTF